MLNTDSADQLAAIFNQFSVPMFAAERASEQSEFKIVCINHAHAKATGCQPDAMRYVAVRDLLPEEEANIVVGRYSECARTEGNIRYLETLTLPEGVQRWDTSIQHVRLASGGDRVIGTALRIADGHTSEGTQATLDNVRYFSTLADMQLQNLISMFEAARVQGLFNNDNVGRVARLGGICRSVQRSVEDIREAVRRGNPDLNRHQAREYIQIDDPGQRTMRAIYETAQDTTGRT